MEHMPKQYVFVDDSGDAGFAKTNTDHLIIAAVIIIDEDKRKLLSDAINLFRRRLGWNELDEFKFSRTNKNTLLELIDFIKGFDFKAYAVVLDKNNTPLNQIPKGKASTYDYVIKELLIRIGATDQIITIDGKSEKAYAQKTRTYLRQSLKEHGIEKVSIRFVDSRKDSLIQLADIIAGTIARSYKDKSDAQKYLKLLKNKIVKIDKIKP